MWGCVLAATWSSSGYIILSVMVLLTNLHSNTCMKSRALSLDCCFIFYLLFLLLLLLFFDFSFVTCYFVAHHLLNYFRLYWKRNTFFFHRKKPLLCFGVHGHFKMYGYIYTIPFSTNVAVFFSVSFDICLFHFFFTHFVSFYSLFLFCISSLMFFFSIHISSLLFFFSLPTKLYSFIFKLLHAHIHTHIYQKNQHWQRALHGYMYVYRWEKSRADVELVRSFHFMLLIYIIFYIQLFFCVLLLSFA